MEGGEDRKVAWAGMRFLNDNSKFELLALTSCNRLPSRQPSTLEATKTKFGSVFKVSQLLVFHLNPDGKYA